MRWIAIGFGIFLAGVVFLANTQAGVFNFVNRIPLGDKWGHFILIGTMSFLIVLACWRSGWVNNGRQLWLASAGFACLVTAEEFSQMWLPTRTFSYMDLTFNYLGIVCFGLVAWFIIRRSQTAPHDVDHDLR